MAEVTKNSEREKFKHNYYFPSFSKQQYAYVLLFYIREDCRKIGLF